MHGFVQSTAAQQSDVVKECLGNAKEFFNRGLQELGLAATANLNVNAASKDASKTAQDGNRSSCYSCFLTILQCGCSFKSELHPPLRKNYLASPKYDLSTSADRYN